MTSITENDQRDYNNLFLILIEFLAQTTWMSKENRKKVLKMIKDMKGLSEFKQPTNRNENQ